MTAVRFERCETCRYFKPNTTDIFCGLCRARPPVRDDRGFGVWPMTERTDWCGQWAKSKFLDYETLHTSPVPSGEAA